MSAAVQADALTQRRRRGQSCARRPGALRLPHPLLRARWRVQRFRPDPM